MIMIDSGISNIHHQALHNLVVELKPRLALEVGMANGLSTRAILSGIGDGNLISIDPYQSTDWHSEGIRAIAEFSSKHQLIELPDYLALPQLVAANTRIDFAYIDGWHTFDYTLLDFFYIDRMLNVGGTVGFNDCHMAAVNKVLGFIKTHRDYIELPILKPSYNARNLTISVLRRLLDRQTQDRYFKKVTDSEPKWNFFEAF
jgi:hypothetical protein